MARKDIITNGDPLFSRIGRRVNLQSTDLYGLEYLDTQRRAVSDWGGEEYASPADYDFDIDDYDRTLSEAAETDKQDSGDGYSFWDAAIDVAKMPLIGMRNTIAATIERAMQGYAEKYKSQAAEDEYSIGTLHDFRDYLALEQERNDIIKDLYNANPEKLPAQAEVRAKLDQFNLEHPEYIRLKQSVIDQVRQNTKLQDLLYNTEAGDFATDAGITWQTFSDQVTSGTMSDEDRAKQFDEYLRKYSWLGAAESGAHLLYDTGIAGLNTLGVAIGQTIGNIWNVGKSLVTGEDFQSYQQNSVRNSLARGTLSQDQMRALQKYDFDNLSDSQIEKLRNSINERLGYLDRDAKEHQADYKEKLDQMKSGTWYYNPKWISEEYRNARENRQGRLLSWNPLTTLENLYYNAPELGSSFSDLTAFATSVGAQNIGARLGSIVAKRSPIGGLALTVAGSVTGLGATIQGRYSETAQEAISAWTSRLQKNLEHHGAATPELYQELSDKLAQYDIDTSDMSDDEILGSALAFNIKSSTNNIYNQLMRDSHKGLEGLIARNNSLGVNDFLQTMPYVGNSASMINKFATNLSRKIKPLGSMRYTNKMYQDAYQQMVERSVGDAVKGSAVSTWIDKRIDKLARRGGADVATQVARRNLYTKIGRKTGRDLAVAATEGVEEGQQFYITHQFENGMYDDEGMYSFGPNINFKALADDYRLGYNAVLSYFGLNFGDPLNGDDELQQNMESGAATGMFFPFVGNVASNIRGKNEYSIRQMTKDYRNDKLLIRTIGENYGKQQIDLQTDALFEAYKKGMTGQKAERAFETLKQYANPQRIDNDDIELAKSIARSSYAMYSQTPDDVLEKLNIVKGSEDHKDFVKLGTESIMDYDDIIKKQDDVNRDLIQTVEQVKRAVQNKQMQEIPGLTMFERMLRSRYNSMRNRHAKYMDEADKIEKEIVEKEKRGINTTEDKNRARELRDKVGIVPPTYESVRDALLNVAFLNAQLRAVYDLTKQTEDQAGRLKQIRKLGGNSINTKNLDRINVYLKNRRDKLAKEYNKLLDDAAELLSTAKNKKDRRNYVEQMFDKFGFYRNNDELKTSFEIQALNEALSEMYMDKVDVFVGNFINPTRAKYLISKVKYKDLTDEQRAEYESKYRKDHPDEKDIDYEKAWNKSQQDLLDELNKYERQAFMDRTAEEMDETDRAESMRATYQNAAIAVMRSEMANRAARKRVLNDYYEQERMPNPDDIDKAEEGDVRSQSKVEQVANDPNEPPEPSTPRTNAPKEQAAELGKSVDKMKKQMGYTGSEPNKHDEQPPTAQQVKQDTGKIKGSQAQAQIDELTNQELASLWMEPEQSVLEQDQIDAERASQKTNKASQATPIEKDKQAPIEEPNVDLSEDETSSLNNQDPLEALRQQQGQRNPDTVPETQQPKDDHKEDPVSNQKNDNVSHETNQPKAEPDSKVEDIPEDVWMDILPTAEELDAYMNQLASEQADKIEEDLRREVSDEMLSYLDQIDYEQDEISQQRKMDQVAQPRRKRSGTAFNYRPDATTPMTFKNVNGKPLDFGKGIKMGTGSELNAKLSTPGWFNKERADQCFYFVSWPSKEQLGVHMAIPDGNTLYIVSLPDETGLNNYDAKTAASIRQMRESIINAYLPTVIDSPTVVRSVKPASISVSNGRFNNNEQNGVPQYRSLLGENAGFGLSENIEELSQQIDHPDSTGVMFYVGRSEYVQFVITDIYKEQPVPGTIGVPGKIYISVPTQSRPGYNMKEGGTPSLLTLHEYRFTEDPGVERASTPTELNEVANRLQEHFDANGNLTGTPTMGELILRLLAYKGGLHHMFSNNVLPGPAYKDKFVDIITNMIVNHGDYTMLPNDKPRRYPGWVINKQLNVTNENGQVWLHIGNAGTQVIDNTIHRMIDNVDQLTGGNRWIARQDYVGPEVLHVNLNELFKPENEILRKRIIAQINNSFHWNTELFTSDYTTSMLDAIKGEFLTYLDINNLWGPGQTIRLFNSPNLEFDYDDFHDQTGRRRVIKETTLLAWMLKTGKLTTNAGTNGQNMFTAPFVFPTGVNTVTTNDDVQVSKEVAQTKKRPKTKSKILTTDFAEWLNSKEHTEGIPADQKNLVIDPDIFTKTNGKVAAKVVLWVDPSLSAERFNAEVHRKVEEIVPELIADFKQKHPDLPLNESKVFYDIPYGPYGGGNKCADGKGHPCVTIRLVKGKEFKVCVNSLGRANGVIKQIIGTSSTSNYISGVYSRVRGKGHIDTNKSRKWLQDTLGLSEDQIIVTSAFSRALSSMRAYAVTNLAVDAITKEIFGRIILGEEGGLGEEYHEGWHYVNLLLHNKSTRQKVYEEWRKRHPKDVDATDTEVEEHMAEDFRDYMMKYDDNARSGRVLRFFRNMYTFIRTYITHGRQISRIYRAIRNGEYKGNKLDSESIREFAKAYPNGIALSIPGVSQNEINDFRYIKDFRTYYAVVQSLTNLILGGLNIKNIHDVQSITGEKITRIVKDAYDVIENDEYLYDVLAHPKAFQSAITKAFEQLGLKVVNTKKKKLDKDHENGKDSADVSDNIWDIDHLEVSRKNNVSFRAKLFFSTIPSRIKSIDDGIVTYENVQDEYTGSTQFVPFSETWNKIMEDLSECDSFDNIDSETGDYTSSSIMYNVRRLAKVDSFYAYVYDQLNELNSDINGADETARNIALETKIQIFNTIIGTKADIDVIDIDNPKPEQFQIEDETDFMDISATLEEDIPVEQPTEPSDSEKRWSIRDSLSLQSRIRLPRRWSNNFATSTGAVANDAVGQHISDEWKRQEAIIRQNMFNAANNGDQAQTRLYLCNLLQHWGIPVDELVIDNYADMFTGGNIITAAQEIYGTNQSTGSIAFFETQIRNLVGNNMMLGKNKDIPIDSIYTRYGRKRELPISRLAIVYSRVHPSASEFSVTSPEGSILYPFTNNNFATDRTRDINNNKALIVDKMRNCAQCAHSLILQAADINLSTNNTDRNRQIRLKTFVGVKDNTQLEGADYFGITPLEDYVSKLVLTFNKRLIDPTMADKKGYYSIASDTLSSLIPRIAVEGAGKQRVSFDGVRHIFAGYINDELNTLMNYYNQGNIQAILNNPDKRLVNYHGNIGTYPHSDVQYYAFGGNGGMFRYYYDLPAEFAQQVAREFNLDEVQLQRLNMNQLMELLWNIENTQNQEKVLADETPTDGFDNIRRMLSMYSSWFGFNSDSTADQIQHRDNMIDDILTRMVNAEVNYLSTSDDVHLIETDTNGSLFNRAIPQEIINEYYKMLVSNPNVNNDNILSNAIYSAIANHVIMQAISIQEIEKVYSGDSAMYKWVYYTNLPEDKRITYTYTNDLGEQYTWNLKVLDQKDVDKTKRLGGILSPGTNLKSTFSALEIQNASGLLDDFGTSKYTFMNIADIKAKSAYIEDLGNAFRREWVYQYYNQNRQEDVDLQRIFSDNDYAQSLFDKLSPEQKAVINKNVEDSLGPYNDITVSDAQVTIRPAMYRKLRIAMGEWSFQPDQTGYSDEIAYNLLEKDASWMTDPEKIKIVRKLQLKPLKMSYFGNDMRTDFGSPLVVPVYNKMAMFPLFKYIATSDTGRKLYERMNAKGNEIDMIGFESAVKVGCNQGMYRPNAKGSVDISSLDEAIDRPSSASIDYKTGEIRGSFDKDQLVVQVQDLDNLHLQLNTDAHEDTERSLGTQMAKIAMCNVIDDMMYGNRTGAEIKQDIIDVINAMTYKGREDVFKRFFKFNPRTKRYDLPNHDAIRDFLLDVAVSNGMDSATQRILSNGGTISSLSSRKLFEQAVCSMINSNIVDINTFGGAAVQQSVFGFTGLRKKQVSEWDPNNPQYQELNNGEEPKWVVYENDGHTIKGHVQVFLSMRFFRHVIPHDMYQRGDYNEMRKWLFDNNIIGSNSEPFGVGYRIPTQGPSSIFSYQIVDVLPDMAGDTIIVPKEFTAQTGSDYDVDKIYIASFAYKIDKKTGKPYRPTLNAPESPEISAYDSYKTQSSDALRNKLLQNYLDLMMDQKNLSNARGSIDVLTDTMKKGIVPAIKVKSYETPYSGYELIPSFQSSRKNEYILGKQDLAIFALNTTGHSMTQLTHLGIKHNIVEQIYGFKQPYDIVGNDGYKISDWLSAMVSAHADVAKDPFIFTLNVNKVTATTTAYLLRGGMGASTFTFLAQPIIRKYAARVTAKNGMYGVGQKDRFLKRSTRSELKDEYYRKFRDVMNILRQHRYPIAEEYENMLNDYNMYLDDLFIDIESGKEKLLRILDVFDVEYAKTLINPVVYNNESSDETLYRAAMHYAHQLIVMYVYEKIQPHVDILSNLVTQSRIDTKNFGNNIVSQLNFINGYYDFKYDEEKNSEVFIPKEYRRVWTNSDMALYDFFDGTFLDKKLQYATKTLRQILSNQTFTATNFYEKVYYAVMRELFGLNIKHGVDSNGRQIIFNGYVPVLDDDTVQRIGNIIDTILRHKAMVYQASKSQLKDSPISVDFTFGNDSIERINKLRELIIGGKFGSVPRRLAACKWYITNLYNQYRSNNQPIPDYLQLLCNTDGSIRNEFLNWVTYQTGKVDRIVLSDSQMNVDGQFKDKAYSALEELLELTTASTNSFDQSMVRQINQLAKDLIIYSYYTTYNNNTPNSFFDAIPVEYRSQYDNSISQMLRNYRGQQEQDFIDFVLGGNQLDRINFDGRDFTLLIVRNLWYDDSIVPDYGTVRIAHGKGIGLLQNGQIQTDYNVIFRDVQGVGQSFGFGDNTKGSELQPILAISEFESYGQKFLKIKGKDGQYYIYRRIGKMVFKKSDIADNIDHRSDLVTKYVYEITPKLGHVERGNNIPEWLSDGLGLSMFDENAFDVPIPTDAEINAQIGLNEADIRAFMSKNRTRKLLDSKGNPKYNRLIFVRDDQTLNLPASLPAVEPTEPSSGSQTTIQYYTGNITPDANTIFVFGSNPEGRHGAGAAKIAREQFGAQYGVGEGLTGNAYALPTKDLRVKANNGFRSIPKPKIINSIQKLYEVAKQNPQKQFKIAYRNTTEMSLNGYTGLEMIDMFIKAGPIPTNIIFSQEWVETGRLDNAQIDVPGIPQVDQTAQDLSKAQDSMMDKYDKQQSELDKKIQDAVNAVSGGVGENISSRGSEFARMLTNPGNNITVEYKGKVFRNAEHAYQTWKSGEFDEVAYNSTAFKPIGTKPVNKATSFQTMVDILTAKLQQHPELIQGINERGGIEYLNKSWHSVTGDAFWETQGNFMNALKQAYLAAQQSQATQQDINDLKTQDDPENFNNAEQSKQVLESDRTILSNEELKYWNEHGVKGKPRILVASEHTDPVWEQNYQKVIDIIEGRRKVNSWQQVEPPSSRFPNGRWKKVEVTGHDFAGFYIITKHDGLPILKLLQTKIPKLIHFSVTSLGGTQYEPGVMKYNDMLDRIEDYIKQGLDPESVTMRIDPIVPGVTNMQDVENIIKRSVAMGIKRVKFSVMDAYKGTREAFAQFNYDFDTYYGYTPDGRQAFHAKPEVLNSIAQQMLAFKEKYGITLHTCAENINISGIEKDGCLSISAVNNMLGTSIPDVEENQSGQRDGCTCFGGKVDALSGNDKCNSTCWYCYMAQFKNEAHEYYNPDGTLKNDMYTQTRELQQSTQPVQRDLFANDPVFDHLSDKEKEQGKQFKDYCKGE